MSVATIRTGIKNKISNIAGIGKVLDYVVWTEDWQVIYEKFAEGTDRVNVFMIGLSASSNAVVSAGIRSRDYTFNIVGYYSIKTTNESSKAFENIIDLIINAFDSDNSIASGSEIVQKINLNSLSNTLFVQHPCHTSIMSLTVRDRTALDNLCG